MESNLKGFLIDFYKCRDRLIILTKPQGVIVNYPSWKYKLPISLYTLKALHLLNTLKPKLSKFEWLLLNGLILYDSLQHIIIHI